MPRQLSMGKYCVLALCVSLLVCGAPAIWATFETPTETRERSADTGSIGVAAVVGHHADAARKGQAHAVSGRKAAERDRIESAERLALGADAAIEQEAGDLIAVMLDSLRADPIQPNSIVQGPAEITGTGFGLGAWGVANSPWDNWTVSVEAARRRF